MNLPENKEITQTLPPTLQPASRWKQSLQSLFRLIFLTLGYIKNHSYWDDWSDDKIRKFDVTQAKGLSDVKILSLSQKICFINPKALASWSNHQISALTNQQLQTLTPHQLQALIQNESISAPQIVKIIKALKGLSHCQKISEILHTLKNDRHRKEKLQIITDTMKHFSHKHMQNILTVVAQSSDYEAFEAFFRSLSFETLQRLFEEGRLQHFDPQYQDMSLEIETKEFENNMMQRHLDLQIAQFHQLRRLSSLEPITAILKDLKTYNRHNKQMLMPRLNTIIHNASSVLRQVGRWVDIPEDLRDSLLKVVKVHKDEVDFDQAIRELSLLSETLSNIEDELVFRSHCLQEKNLTTTHFIEHWKNEYLPRKYDDKIWQLDRNKEKKEEYYEEVKRLHQSAVRDTQFIHESFRWFTDKIRLDSGIGPFSVAFFTRIVRRRLREPCDFLLTTQEFESLLLLPGMLDLYAFMELQSRVEKIQSRLARRLYIT